MLLKYRGWWPVAAASTLLFVAACSAANSTTEEAAITSAAVGEQERGFRCDAANVAMPTDLPDVTTCINDGNGAAEGCRGWTPAGPWMRTSDELRSLENLGAQAYYIKPDTSTLCLYLYRGDRAITNNTLNGIHCYNTTTCDACWWDAQSKAGTAPVVNDLRHVAADGSKCSECHRNGPLLPKYTLWDALQRETRALHAVCSRAGGPTWHQAPNDWTNRSPDRTKVVPAPQGCGDRGCHSNGFASGGDYCQFVNHAFGDASGAMRGYGAMFTTKTSCENFRSAMGCQEAQLNCDSEDVVENVAPTAGTSSSSSGGASSSSGGGEEPLPEDPPIDPEG
jgi:hypothetical protein